MNRQSLTLAVKFNRFLGADYYHLALDLSEMAAKPLIKCGQFAELSIAGFTLPRPLSILKQTNDSLEFLFAKRGSATTQMTRLVKGNELTVTWPLGNGFTFPDSGRVILVGGGIGLPPMIFACAGLQEQTIKATALFGFRNQEQHNALSDLFPQTNTVRVSTEDGSFGQQGLVSDLLLAEIHVTNDISAVFCCGPDPMMKAIAAICNDSNIKCQLSLETYMGCGIGICAACAVELRDEIHPVLCCKQGPVFSAELLEDYS
jgi:dihydroorotate dehydrogenase electron transfer subunit